MKKWFIFIYGFLCCWMNGYAQRTATIIEQPANIPVSKQYRLNSSYREVNMSITPDGRYMFFMSSRGLMPWSTANYTTFKGQPQYDGDIWYSERKGKDWQTPICIGANINTRMGEDEPNVSPDGQVVYFQSWHNEVGNSWEDDGGPYYKASRFGSSWGKKTGLGGGISSFFRENRYATDGMTISPDGKVFIVAAGKDYDGAMDLYISYLQNGYWTSPKVLSISTFGDERSPFIAADGETLYFASDGYNGFGGLDIYKVSLKDAKVSSNPKVYNIGSPFNTARHDYGFTITSDGKETYFIRDGDIYFADVTKSPKEMKPNQTLIIKGVVRDAKTKRPLQKRILIKETCCNSTKDAWSNPYTGEYMVILNVPKDSYDQSVNKEAKYQAYSNIIKSKTGENIIIADIDLVPIEGATTNIVTTNNNRNDLKKRQEEERKRRLEELRKKREAEENIRNQEAACRM
ncbi:hypothetical protein AD998_16000 [bacterium 336/3]|nr:hypothetical protein AD998_16000 [bacterium 336/3]